MKLSDFDYKLPEKLIANQPASPRDSSRLLLINRKTRKISHHKFQDLPQIINKDYVLVFNKTKVIPARLNVLFENNSKGEILLHKNLENNNWECLCKPAKKFKTNKSFVVFGVNKNNSCEAITIKVLLDGSRQIEFKKKYFDQWIEENGITPLPPYIKNPNSNPSDYQTVYAKNKGSVAAPTAGLHFTENIFNELEKKEIQHEFVVLHVGRGTFEPVKTDNIFEHKMHEEWYSISELTAQNLNKFKSDGKKILAVGTTSARTIESNFKNNKFSKEQKNTALFIYPGYKFNAIDALLTNFHLPKSTLLMLISAFADKELIFKAYEIAIKEKYRFYSFGDSMLII